MYIDVNNDGFLSPADALAVINQLNGEGAPGDKREPAPWPIGPAVARSAIQHHHVRDGAGARDAGRATRDRRR